jgi:hypothetical protein
MLTVKAVFERIEVRQPRLSDRGIMPLVPS